MNKDTKDIINHTASTVLNIAQMAQSGERYALQGDVKDRQKMIMHTILAVAGITCLLAIGIAGLIESHDNC